MYTLRMGVFVFVFVFVDRQRHEQHLAEDGGLRAQRGRAHVLWQGIHDGGNLLRHDLSGAVDIGAPVKLDPHDGEARGR